MGGVFSGELLQAANSRRRYSSGQPNGVEESQADVRNTEAGRYRRITDRGIPAQSDRSKAPRSPQGRRGRTWNPEADDGAPGVSSSAEDLQCCSKEETLSGQSVRRCRVSGEAQRLVPAALHDVDGANQNRGA